MNRAAEILTVGTSVPAMVLCFLVLRHWVPEAIRAIRDRRDAADWLILGVAVSFGGMLLFLTYWTLFWAASTAGLEDWVRLLHDNGPTFNLVTRQAAVIAAAWCHLKAYHTHSDQASPDPSFQLQWALAVGALCALVLVMAGGF